MSESIPFRELLTGSGVAANGRDAMLDDDTIFDVVLDWIMKYIFTPSLVIAVVLFTVGMPFIIYGIYKDSIKPTFELQKDDWNCTAYHVVSTPAHMVGKVMMPETMSTVCDQWTSK